MAILSYGVDTNIIKIVGQWRSNKMLQYVNVQADPLTRSFAKIMVQYGSYCLHPNHEVSDLVL